jgi:glycosyltransferase involved in cell wall biosynthesis
MRIALIAPPWAPVPPPGYGGIEAVVDRLARGLKEAGHTVSLFTTGDSTCPVPRRWKLEHAQGHRLGLTLPELYHVMAAYDELDGFDVVHDHTLAGPVYAERFPGLPVVTTIHGTLDEELGDLCQRLAHRVGLIAVSRAQRAGAPELPVSRVIHHGLDAADFPFGDGGGGYLLFLGRMAADKGPHRAVEVARKARMPILLAGKLREPSEVSYYENVLQPLLGPDAAYLGEVPHERKVELLAGARALLFPIRWAEPFGVVMLEALACGTPVLAFPEGAAPEVIHDGQTGFLCRDEAEMADAVSRLGGIDRRDCRAAVEGHFSTARMVAEHLELFEEIADRRD